MESGFHSELWFELNRLFDRPTELRPFVAELARRISHYPVTAICGPQTGGARLAAMVGAELSLPAHAAERVVSPSSQGLYPVSYRFSLRSRDPLRGQAVAIVDDAISAGSAVRGCYADLVAAGARPIVLGALLIFGQKAADFARTSDLAFEGIAPMDFGMWLPADCPMCRAGGAIEQVSD